MIKDWKTGEKDICRDRCRSLRPMQLKVTSAGEMLNNQVGRMTCSVGSQPLSLATPMDKMAIVAEIKVTLGLNHIGFHSPCLT